jgi:lysyl-tRNA synthetase class 2
MPSSVIRSFAYLPAERRLEIVFASGRRYAYLDVPAALVEDMRRAFAKGEFFNAHIRDRFRHEPQTQKA